SAAKGFPLRETIAGDPAQRILRPGMIEFWLPGRGSNQVAPLLSSTPVPGTTTPQPKMAPRVDVSDTIFRSWSITVTCVVCPISGPATISGAAPCQPDPLNGQGSPAPS